MLLTTEFRNNLFKTINEANLPVDIIYYTMKDIMNEITMAYNNELAKERAEAAAKEETIETVEETKEEEK